MSPDDWTPQKLPKIPLDKDRAGQLIVALALVVAATFLMVRGIDRGGSAVWGTSIVCSFMAIGAIVLAVDKTVRGDR